MFERLANLIRGFFGLFVSGLERRNPEALLEVDAVRMNLALHLAPDDIEALLPPGCR